MNRRFFQVLTVVTAIASIVGGTARAAEDSGDAADEAAKLPNRWVLLCCGLPGDDGHRDRLTEACEKIMKAANPVLGVAPGQLRVLAGDDQMRQTLSEHTPSEIGICTRESVAQAISDLSDRVAKQDACWVILLGHAHLYDQSSQYNVSGPDFDQTDFSAWTSDLACREQVFWITMPVSGFWIPSLSGDGRVVISATEPDLEVTGTEMPYALADLLAGKGRMRSLKDIDGDGELTLLDLYLTTNLEIHERFLSIARMKTEHAQLDDNGDKRGSEIQSAYLPNDPAVDSGDDPSPDQRSNRPVVKPIPDLINNENLDGFRSRHIIIRTPLGATESRARQEQHESPTR